MLESNLGNAIEQKFSAHSLSGLLAFFSIPICLKVDFIINENLRSLFPLQWPMVNAIRARRPILVWKADLAGFVID